MQYSEHKISAVASDQNSPFLRNFIWVSAMLNYPKVLGIAHGAFGIESKRRELVYLSDLDLWTRAHNELKDKILKDYNVLEKLIDDTEKYCREMNEWSEKNIFKKNLSKLSNKKLFNLFNEFTKKQAKAYTLGTALPTLDFLGFSFIEGNLKKYLEEKLDKEEVQKYFSVFSEPINNSFAQDQEEDLLKLLQKYYDDKDIVKSIREDDSKKIKEKFPVFFKDLEKHTKKHCWVYYVYAGPAFSEANFLEFLKDYLERYVNPERKLLEIKEKKEKNIKFKKEYIEKLNPDKFNLFIINIASKVVWAKPRRNDYQSRTYYHIEGLMREIAKRLFLSFDQVRSCPFNMIKNALLENQKVDPSFINELYKYHIVIPESDDKVVYLVGKKAEKFAKQIIRPKENINENVKELKGDTACPGKAKGKVKIVNNPKDMDKMEYGDILVSEATTPNIVAAMKKAAAIVTNEGGLTCHASIVSRELNIPCIVGTRVATHVLKDGDEVEVDASKGVIKKIK